ncbi:MAG TPA: DUF2723 domain-containing protein [Bacteroidales bacterium]|nr:DUF2723 domain-containing protein [Bacteroidales bacterium]
MKSFRSFNLITGWIIFIIAAVVYLMTIEPTASFWDCGEFITSSYKLEVGHPPGAPFFMVLGNFFMIFTSNAAKVSVAMNSMSALASAFAILFLFWTITHLARKIILVNDDDYTLPRILAVMGAGAVGALAYTFSDTFWFSAVEAEVYGTSSLFTAFVFWAILKWENEADNPRANKWIILIAYLMGLSLGVHLLNLLAIPAIVFVVYFRKYKPTVWGIIASLLISVGLLGAMMYLIIPGFVGLGAALELVFVNGMGLPYQSGLITYAILLFVVLGFLVYYTHKRRLVLWNTVVLVVTVLAIGYSSYAVILIRSNADTPLDESNPDTAFNLLSYLNRDQYGQTPLFYGNYFNAPAIEQIEGRPKYYRENGKYVKVTTPDYKYHPDFKGFFPRMWSEQDQHINKYLYWGGMKESDLFEPMRDQNGNPVRGQNGQYRFDRSKPLAKPSFAANLRFFFRYQIGYMYLRYFMWNFAGRQNDIQGHGELTNGNWISGIPFIDDARLGPQNLAPDYLKNNRAHNTYFLLPLILGLIGLFFHYKYHNKDFWVVALLFLFTGLAIVVYLNQYPLQPRERDYAYAGSFYAFAIWVGLGVLGLIRYLSKNYKSMVAVGGVTLASLILVPGIMAEQNWDDHDRSGRYTARDFAYDYLNSCEKNAVIFTNGDNDTFPLWYIQEVEGVRTDVRVINLSYFTADWYIEQMTHRMYESDPVKFSLTFDEYRNGTRDYVLLGKNTLSLLDEKYDANKTYFRSEYAELYNRFLDMAAKSKLPEVAAKDYNQLKKGPDVIHIELFANALGKINRRRNELGFNTGDMDKLISDVESMARRIDDSAMPLDDGLTFITSDNPRFKTGRYFFPGSKFVIKVDTAALVKNGVVTDAQRARMTDEMRFDLSSRRGVPKNLLMIMDLVNEVNKGDWQRPVYYAITASRDNYLDLEKYLHREGLGYRLLPVTGNNDDLFTGSVNTDVMYDKVMNVFRWGNIDDPSVYLDENNLRMLTNFRYTFATLANALASEGKKDSANAVLDKCMKLMPNSRVPYNASMMPIIQIYYTMDEPEKANTIIREFSSMIDRELYYYEGLMNAKPNTFSLSEGDYRFATRNLLSMFSLANSFNQQDMAQELMTKLQAHNADFPGLMNMQ